MIWLPRSPFPAARFFRTFQSNAVLSAFPTATPPPAMKKVCGRLPGIAIREKVSTNRAISTV